MNKIISYLRFFFIFYLVLQLLKFIVNNVKNK